MSPATRFEAAEEKATKRPSALIAGAKLSPFASAPELSTLTRVGLAGLPVVDEDVAGAVRVAGDEVGGIGVERDEAPVGADRGEEASTVPLLTAGRDAHAEGRPRPGARGGQEQERERDNSDRQCQSPQSPRHDDLLAPRLRNA